uniref:Uncharacterized protein n=1 Tax=Arion vulgaris TaxID=1028688 RepID=A0A0B6ZVR3_9EUPU
MLIIPTQRIFKTNPALAMSLTLICPVAKTIAFGGVATGRMKAIEHARTAGYNKYNGFIRKDIANSARIGQRMLADAALLVISVMKEIASDRIRTINHGSMPANTDIREPIHNDRPES